MLITGLLSLVSAILQVRQVRNKAINGKARGGGTLMAVDKNIVTRA